MVLAREVGVEPTSAVLETAVLPLNYTHKLAAVSGLEPEAIPLTAGRSTIELHGIDAEIGAGGAESNPRPEAYKATALPLSYAG